MRPRMRPHGNFGWGVACDDVQAPNIENRRFGWDESAPRSTERLYRPRPTRRRAFAFGLGKFHPEGSALRRTWVRAHGDFVANNLPPFDAGLAHAGGDRAVRLPDFSPELRAARDAR